MVYIDLLISSLNSLAHWVIVSIVPGFTSSVLVASIAKGQIVLGQKIGRRPG
jgi:hypothetical protein